MGDPMRVFGMVALVAAVTVGCTSSSDSRARTTTITTMTMTMTTTTTTTTADATTVDPTPPDPGPQRNPTTTTPSDVFGNGTYIVGTDIRPGMYRVFGYWARLDDGRGIIDNDGVYENGVGLMKVLPTDSFVEINGGAHPLSASGTLDPVADGFTTGTYLVNWDIQPGRYRISAIDGGTYYARLDASGAVIGEDDTDGDTIVIVDASDWALTFHGVITPA